MTPLRPRTDLGTHRVLNQPPERGDRDPWVADPSLQEAIARSNAQGLSDRIRSFARTCGSEAYREHAHRANRHPPELRSFDRHGHRIDEVDFHPSYHALMKLGLEAGVSAAPWTESEGGHTLHAALLYLMAQTEPSVCCPMSMTYAAVPALQAEPAVGGPWIEWICRGVYDPSSRPAPEKSGVTVGMAMTEKQGGSDVRAGTTRAVRDGEAHRLTGHKWFCSAPMSDGFLTLAHLDEGLTCFFVPRWTPDGQRNPLQIMRLKAKLGDRANASSEIEYVGTWALRVGEPGRGVRTILSMVHHTRLDCLVAPAAFMRRALDEAVHHARHRTTFGKRLVEHDLMAQVLADLVVEAEATTALAFRLARAFDGAARGDAQAAALSRIATPVAKYWHNKRVVPFVHEAMEVHGGAGYIEDSPLPMLYRQAPLNGIWEGSGNVMCLDVFRAMVKEPNSLDALVEELRATRGVDPRYDAHIETILGALERREVTEAGARHWVERVGIGLQASVLLENGPAEVADAFCATRLGGARTVTFGAGASSLPTQRLLDRVVAA